MTPKDRLKLTPIDELRRELLWAANAPQLTQQCAQAQQSADLQWWDTELDTDGPDNAA